MEPERLKTTLESMIFAAGEPVSLSRLSAVLENVPKDELRKALAEMMIEYSGAGRGIVLERVAGGYQFRTAKDNAFYVRKLLAARPPRLSRPLMETVAIIAYRQPITRPEIEALRGVDCGGVIDTLLERRIVKIAGRKDAPGRPLLYATTPEFLELFGLGDLSGLPDLGEFRELERAIDARDSIDEKGESPLDKPPDLPESPSFNANQVESGDPANEESASAGRGEPTDK
jgi:segregation and condensation protein B